MKRLVLVIGMFCLVLACMSAEENQLTDTKTSDNHTAISAPHVFVQTDGFWDWGPQWYDAVSGQKTSEGNMNKILSENLNCVPLLKAQRGYLISAWVCVAASLCCIIPAVYTDNRDVRVATLSAGLGIDLLGGVFAVDSMLYHQRAVNTYNVSVMGIPVPVK
jgi:hypothetical protein